MKFSNNNITFSTKPRENEVIVKRDNFTWHSGKEILGSVSDKLPVSQSIRVYVQERFKNAPRPQEEPVS